MIHRTMLGSIERFIAILTEHFAGAFPLWLAPVQVIVLPITERTHDYASSVADTLVTFGFRVETDKRNEKIGFKIREAQMQKVPYMLVLGDNEAKSGLVTVRERLKGDIGEMGLEDFIDKILVEYGQKKYD